MKRHLSRALAVLACIAAAVGPDLGPSHYGQRTAKAKAENVPEIPITSVPDFFKLPPDMYFGEGIGIATNSKGHVFVYTAVVKRACSSSIRRAITSRRSDRTLRLRVRPLPSASTRTTTSGRSTKGRTWSSSSVPTAKVLMVLGRRPEPVAEAFDMPAAGRHGRCEVPLRPSTDVALDAARQHLRFRRLRRSRVVKYDKSGRFVKSVGTRGNGNQSAQYAALDRDRLPGQHLCRRSRQRPRAGVGQRSDPERRTTTTSATPGRSACREVRPEESWKQYLFVSNSWPDSAPAEAREFTGEVYKMELDGNIVGKFGKAGKALGEFATIHQMDCRDPDDLYRRDLQLAVAEDPVETAGDETHEPALGDDHVTASSRSSPSYASRPSRRSSRS